MNTKGLGLCDLAGWFLVVGLGCYEVSDIVRHGAGHRGPERFRFGFEACLRHPERATESDLAAVKGRRRRSGLLASLRGHSGRMTFQVQNKQKTLEVNWRVQGR